MLDPTADGTRLVLVHDGFPDAGIRDAHSGGFRLEPDGPPGLTHRFVRFGWKTVGKEGPTASGENFGELDGEGRFALVAGFRNP